MNADSASFELEQQGIWLGEMFSPVVSAKLRSHQFPSSEVFKALGELSNQLLLNMVRTQTVAEFTEQRKQVFGKYFRITGAASGLARDFVPESVLDILAEGLFKEVEADLNESGAAAFGEEARDQALFTVWSLRKIRRLVAQANAKRQILENDKARYSEIAREFSFNLSWSQFHLDILVTSIKTKSIFAAGVLSEVLDGLRAVVNAYGSIRQGLDLSESSSASEPSLPPYEWDDEDQALLDESMIDMNSEHLNDGS